MPSVPNPLDPQLLLAFQRFVTRRGADFTMRLLEAVDDKIDPEAPNVVFRSIALTPLWGNLRYISELALENVISCTEKGVAFSALVQCRPDRRSAGEIVQVDCYPGDEWRVTAKRCHPENVHAPKLSTRVEEDGKRSSSNPLPPRGQRH